MSKRHMHNHFEAEKNPKKNRHPKSWFLLAVLTFFSAHKRSPMERERFRFPLIPGGFCCFGQLNNFVKNHPS